MTDESEYTVTPETPEAERRRLVVETWTGNPFRSAKDWQYPRPADASDIADWAKAHGYELITGGENPTHLAEGQVTGPVYCGATDVGTVTTAVDDVTCHECLVAALGCYVMADQVGDRAHDALRRERDNAIRRAENAEADRDRWRKAATGALQSITDRVQAAQGERESPF